MYDYLSIFIDARTDDKAKHRFSLQIIFLVCYLMNYTQ